MFLTSADNRKPALLDMVAVRAPGNIGPHIPARAIALDFADNHEDVESVKLDFTTTDGEPG